MILQIFHPFFFFLITLVSFTCSSNRSIGGQVMPKFNIVCTPQTVKSTLGKNGGRANFTLKIGNNATGNTNPPFFKVTGTMKDKREGSLYVANKVVDLVKGLLLTYGNYDFVYYSSKNSKLGNDQLTLVVSPVSKSGVSIGAPQKVTVIINVISDMGVQPVVATSSITIRSNKTSQYSVTSGDSQQPNQEGIKHNATTNNTEEKPRIKAKNNDITQLLHLAVESRDLKKVKELLKQSGIKINDVFEENGYTPLSLSLNNECYDIAKVLLKSPNIKVNKLDRHGNLPIGIAAMKGREDLVDIIVKNNNTYVNSLDLCETYPIHWAINGQNINLLKLLLKFGANINQLDSENCTPLFKAIHLGYTDMAKLLLEHDQVSPNKCCSKGISPLYEAVMQGQLEIVQLLLKNEYTKANLGREDTGDAPLHVAIRNYKNNDPNSKKILMELLNHPKPIGLNQPNISHDTPLQVAVFEAGDGLGSNESISNFFLTFLDCKHRDIDLTIKDREGRTPLHLAVMYGNHSLASALLRQKNSCVGMQDHDNRLPLHCAIQNNDENMVYLLASKMDKEHFLIKDSKGHTPLMLALLMYQSNSRSIHPICNFLLDCFKKNCGLQSNEWRELMQWTEQKETLRYISLRFSSKSSSPFLARRRSALCRG